MKLVEFLLYIIVNLINITMIIKHIISAISCDTYTVYKNVTNEKLGKLIIYKHYDVILFGNSHIN